MARFCSLTSLALAGSLLAGRATATMMPDGRDYPEECIHHLQDGHHVESLPNGTGDLLISPTGERVILPPCPAVSAPRYYSSWIVNTVFAHDGISSMVSNWTVPKEPASRGPVPGMSSAYLFNGLENGGGVPGTATMILQPVLSFGKSGCVLNPLAGWHFTAFQVMQSGRAYCGPAISVREGDVLQGRMELVGQGQWRTTADAGARGMSVHTTAAPNFDANAAYLTLEGMVVYNCKALPGQGVKFTGNSILGANQQQLTPSWKTEVTHTDCQPSAHIDKGGDVELSWSSADSAAVQAPLVV